MDLKITDLDYHRNGVSGNGFYVALFQWKDADTQGKPIRNMVATIFPERGQCSVFDVDELKAGNIQFAHGNSWRGDNFEPELRAAIDEQRKMEGVESPFAPDVE